MKFSLLQVLSSPLFKVVGCLGSIVASASFMTVIEPAQAQLQVCNRSNKTAYIAVGYGVGNDKWRSEGWFEITPRQCEVVVETALTSGDYYYLYGGDRGDNWVWEGTTGQNFCVHPTDKFNYVATGEGCGRNGSELRPFFEVQVDSSNYTMNLR